MDEEQRPDNITDEELPANYEYVDSERPDFSVNPLEQYEIQDPAKRRRTGKMPAGLRKYWNLYDMKHRRRRHDPRARSSRRRRRHAMPSFHPAMRRRRRRASSPMFHPAMRRRRRSFPRFHMPTVRYRRRRHDPAFLGLGGGAGNSNFWRAVLQGPVTAIGGIFHNWLVRKYPSVAGGFKIGNGAIGYAGLAGAAVGVALDTQLGGPSMFGHLANSFGSGMLTETVNLPMIEGVATIPTQRAYSGTSKQQALAPYVVNPMPTMGQGIF